MFFIATSITLRQKSYKAIFLAFHITIHPYQESRKTLSRDATARVTWKGPTDLARHAEWRDGDNREMIRILLEVSGYIVFYAANGTYPSILTNRRVAFNPAGV